jgi:hypothetical protein
MEIKNAPSFAIKVNTNNKILSLQQASHFTSIDFSKELIIHSLCHVTCRLCVNKFLTEISLIHSGLGKSSSLNCSEILTCYEIRGSIPLKTNNKFLGKSVFFNKICHNSIPDNQHEAHRVTHLSCLMDSNTNCEIQYQGDLHKHQWGPSHHHRDPTYCLDVLTLLEKNAESQFGNASSCQDSDYPVTTHMHANVIRSVKRCY